MFFFFCTSAQHTLICTAPAFTRCKFPIRSKHLTGPNSKMKRARDRKKSCLHHHRLLYDCQVAVKCETNGCAQNNNDKPRIAHIHPSNKQKTMQTKSCMGTFIFVSFNMTFFIGKSSHWNQSPEKLSTAMNFSSLNGSTTLAIAKSTQKKNYHFGVHVSLIHSTLKNAYFINCVCVLMYSFESISFGLDAHLA